MLPTGTIWIRAGLRVCWTIRRKCENALERVINVINRDDQMSYASSKDEIMHGIEQHQAEIRAAYSMRPGSMVRQSAPKCRAAVCSAT